MLSVAKMSAEELTDWIIAPASPRIHGAGASVSETIYVPTGNVSSGPVRPQPAPQEWAVEALLAAAMAAAMAAVSSVTPSPFAPKSLTEREAEPEAGGGARARRCRSCHTSRVSSPSSYQCLSCRSSCSSWPESPPALPKCVASSSGSSLGGLGSSIVALQPQSVGVG